MIYHRNDWLGDGKMQARSKIVPASPRSEALMLPGEHCRCIETMMRSGIFSRSTNLTLVERENDIMDRIREQVTELPIGDYDLFRGELVHLIPQRPYDFAFLDFLGMPDQDMALWVRNTLMKNIKPGADIAFTFNCSIRSSVWMKRLEESLFGSEDHYSKFCMLAREITEANSWITAYVCMIQWLLEGFSFQLDKPFNYCDKTNRMVLIDCRNITHDGSVSQFDFTPILRKVSYPNTQTKMVKMSNKKSTKTKNSRSISRMILDADTPAKRAAARLYVIDYIVSGSQNGIDGKDIRAGIKANLSRLARLESRTIDPKMLAIIG